MILFSQDEPTGVHYVTSGVVRQFAASEEGREITINALGPGSFFPVGWAINNQTSTHNFQALTAVKLRQAPRQEFQNLLKSDPNHLLDVTYTLLMCLGGLSYRLHVTGTATARKRIITSLRYLAHFFGTRRGEEIILGHKFTHNLLGTLAGVSRERATIEINKLEAEGLLHYSNGKIHIPNLDRIRQD